MKNIGSNAVFGGYIFANGHTLHGHTNEIV